MKGPLLAYLLAAALSALPVAAQEPPPARPSEPAPGSQTGSGPAAGPETASQTDALPMQAARPAPKPDHPPSATINAPTGPQAMPPAEKPATPASPAQPAAAPSEAIAPDPNAAPPDTATAAPNPPEPNPSDASPADTPSGQSQAETPPAIGDSANDKQDGNSPQDSAKTGPNLPASLRESDFDYSACLMTLYTLGARYTEQPAISEADNPDCGIARPVSIQEILPGITLIGDPVMRCDTARHLAFWLRDYLRPASALLPDAPRLTAITPGSTYQCRAVIGSKSTATVSEHALGNAFDIASLHFDNGSDLIIQPRQDDGDLPEAFQAAIRSTACLHFTTVLGPGANAAHDDHLHLDIKARKNGFRLCQ